MSLQSPTKNIQTIHGKNIGVSLFRYVRHSHAESATAICNSSRWQGHPEFPGIRHHKNSRGNCRELLNSGREFAGISKIDKFS